MDSYEFRLTDVSKSLSVRDLQNATLALFSTPMRFPKESPEFMTLEEFIYGRQER